MTGKQVTHCATSDTKKCAPSNAIEKAAYNHGLDVFGHGAWYQPYQEKGKGAKIDSSSAIELTRAGELAIIVGVVLG